MNSYHKWTELRVNVGVFVSPTQRYEYQCHNLLFRMICNWKHPTSHFEVIQFVIVIPSVHMDSWGQSSDCRKANEVIMGLYSLSGKTPNLVKSRIRKIDVMMTVSLWNLAGISAALLPRCLSNFRRIGKVSIRISRLQFFTRSSGKAPFR